MLKNNQVVCITGASDGLGKELALQLARKYTLHFVLCGRNEDKLKQTCMEICSIQPNSKVTSMAFDMLDELKFAQFLNLVSTISVDYLINNAGANTKKALVEDINMDDFNKMFQLNCVSYIKMIQAVYPTMKKKQDGHIINILSSVCLFSNETMAGYTASKQAMNAVHKILQKEAREFQIKVTGIYPGGIDTNFREVARHDYMKTSTVAKAIMNLMELEDDAIPQELVLRPFVEKNY